MSTMETAANVLKSAMNFNDRGKGIAKKCPETSDFSRLNEMKKKTDFIIIHC